MAIKNTGLPLTKLQHTGIPVTNMVKSEHFYQLLGFKNIMQAPFEIENEKGVCVMMQQGEIVIELYQLPDSLLPEIRQRSNGRIDHIAFDVADIDAAFIHIKDAGFEPLEPEPVFLPFWEKGCRYFNISGPDGERLEFNQIL